MWLKCDVTNADSKGHLLTNRDELFVERFAKFDYVSSLGHDHSQGHSRLAIETHKIERRIFVAAFHLCDIAQPEHATIGLDWYRFNFLDAVKVSGNTNMNPIGLGVDTAGSHEHVLTLNTIENLLRRDTQR